MRPVRILTLAGISLVLSGASFASDHELEGTWRSRCLETKKESKYQQVEYAANGTFDGATYTHLGAGCEKLGYIGANRGTYFTDGQKIDLRIDVIEITVKSEKYLEIFNFWGMCNHRDWEIDVPKDVTDTEMCGMEPGTTLYQIFQIDNQRLHMGLLTDELNGTTAERRPSKINRRFWLERQ